MSIADANVDFVPGTDEFTIIIKVEDFRGNGHVFSKGQINMASSGQYVFRYFTSYVEFYIGGTYHYYDSTSFVDGDIIAMVVRTDGMDVYQNNTKIINNGSVGTNTTTNDLILGASFEGATNPWGGSMSYFLMYNAELTTWIVTGKHPSHQYVPPLR